MKNIAIKTLTAISILGAYVNSFNQSFLASIIWGIVNPMLAYYNYKILQKEQAFLFIAFTIAAWVGVINLHK